MLAVKGLPTKDHRAGGGLDSSSRARLLRGAAVCAVVATGIALPFPATSQTIPSTEAGQDSTTRQFNIPAQALSSALAQFGRQAGLQIAFAYETPSGMNSSPVSGTMSPQQALGQMLAGTGATWRIAQGTVVIELTREASDPGMVDLELGADTVMLGTIVISGGAGGVFTSDTPYETPGSVAHISKESIDRLPPTSPGDIFIGTPGVIASGNRGGTSFQLNVRGLQGENRVKTTVDGAEQTTSSYRGYAGNRDEFYIDPDLLAGVDITKGPGGGAIGGSAAFRTISAEDIVVDGRNWGFQIKGGFSGNNTSPPTAGTNLARNPVDRPSFLSGAGWNGSIAAAFMNDRFEGILAYSQRQRGNYFAGEKLNGEPGYLALFANPGGQVANSSEDVRSLLAKGKIRWGESHSLEFGYRLYDSFSADEQWYGPSGRTQQEPLKTRVDTYTLRYHFDPVESDLINIRANLWRSDLAVDSARVGYSIGTYSPFYSSEAIGGDVKNTSYFATSIGNITFDLGADYAKEEYWATQDVPYPPGSSGERIRRGYFADLKYEPSDVLALSFGIRRDSYAAGSRIKFEGGGTSISGGITYSPAPGVQFFGLYKEGFNPPSIRQASPTLRPETAKSWEAGFNILRDSVFSAGDRLGFKGTYFNSNYNDYIIRYLEPTEDGWGRYVSTNLDKAHYQGIELSLSYDARKFFVEGSVNKYIDIKYCLTGNSCSPFAFASDYAASYVPPKYHGSLTAGIRLLDEKLVLGGRIRFASERWGGNEVVPGRLSPVTFWPKSNTVDIFGSYQISEMSSINFSVENLRDRYYTDPLNGISNIPAPGRTARIAVTHRF